MLEAQRRRAYEGFDPRSGRSRAQAWIERTDSPKLHHGTLNAIFLPAVIAFNSSAPSMQEEGKLDRIAQAMGLASGDEVGEAVRKMTATLGLPRGLSELGVTRDLFPRIVAGALKDHSHKTNPREASSEDYEAMLDASM